MDSSKHIAYICIYSVSNPIVIFKLSKQPLLDLDGNTKRSSEDVKIAAADAA